MPYVKPLRAKVDRISRLLKGYGLNGNKLSAVLGCVPATALKKLSNPELLTLGDIRKISAEVNIPIEEIRSAI